MKRYTLTTDRFIKHVTFQEWSNAKHIAHLRSIAPKQIASHLPEMFDFDRERLCFSTELLLPIPDEKSYLFESLPEARLFLNSKEKDYIIDQIDVGSVAVTQIKNATRDTLKHIVAGSVNELHSVLSRIPEIDANHIANKINFQICAAAIIPAAHNIPFLKSETFCEIQDTLKWLKTHNVKWCDLHCENLMIRPTDNKYVIIDFEHYIVDFNIPM